MAIEDIDLGAVPNDGTGDSLRVAGQKINDNNAEFETTINNKGDMFKAIYDTEDNGIVDKAQNVIYKAELNQNVTKGNLLFAVGRNIVTGDSIVGLADNTVSFADKTVGMALDTGTTGTIIEVVKIGFIEDVDTSLFAVGETVYLSTNGTFDQKSNITTGIFNPVGFVVKSGFADGVIIIDTTATESIDTDNTINNSNVTGRTVTEALDNLNNASGGVQTVTGQSVDNTDPLNPIINLPLYKSVQADISRANQTTIALANQQANTFEEYFEDSFIPSVTDNFKVSIRWKWSCDVTQASAIFRVTFSDGVNPDIELITRVEPKDSAGTGEVVNILTGGVITGNVNTGTSERLVGIEVADVVLNQGTSYNLKLEWTNENANTDTTIYSSTIRWEQKTQNF
tara:strand:- start:2008 stop:3201 length:1194 start_codon:yes stop_codon:yes gene_type:complete